MIKRTPTGTAYDVTGTWGPCVVLVHGLGLNLQSWLWQVPELAKTYRVITFDLYGHGNSAKAPSPPSLSLFSGQILELLDLQGISTAAVAGFSLGGMIARRFAMDHQDRLWACLLYTSDAADDLLCVDLGGRRIIKKKKIRQLLDRP